MPVLVTWFSVRPLFSQSLSGVTTYELPCDRKSEVLWQLADDRTLGLIVDRIRSPLDDGVESIMPFESGATGHEHPESGLDTGVKTSLPKET